MTNPEMGHNDGPPLDDDLDPTADVLRILFDPICFAQLDVDSEEIDNQYEIGELIRSCPDLDKLTAAQIAGLYNHLKDQFEELTAVQKEFSKFIELIKNVKLPEAFDREKLKTITLQDGTRVTKSDRTTASIIGPQADAFDWLRENGYPDIIKETVNSSTMAATAKEILSNAKVLDTGMVVAIDPDMPIDLPADLFEVRITPTTSVTKGKKKS